MSETEVIIPEVCGIEAERIATETGIVPAAKHELEVSFGGLFAQAQQLITEAEQIDVTDASQVREMKRAREVRLGLRGVRIDGDKIHKALKEDSLRRGRAIDGMRNVVKYMVEPVENRMMDMEKFAERQEAARVTALIEERTPILEGLDIDPAAYNLGWMDQDTFQSVVDRAKQDKADQIERERKAEADRIAKDKADREERARIVAENEKLTKQRAAIEKKAKRDKAAADAKLKTEREARAKVERETAEQNKKQRAAIEKAEAEAAQLRREAQTRKDAELKATEDAAKAPDKTKFLAYAKTVRELPVPVSKSKAGKVLSAKITGQSEKFAAWIEGQVKAL